MEDQTSEEQTCEVRTSEEKTPEVRTSSKFLLTMITLLATVCILINLVLIVSAGYLLIK